MTRTTPGYYAVAVDRNPGVFYTWEECEREVSGYSNAQLRKFPTVAQAEEYAGIKPAWQMPGGDLECAGPPFYAVARGFNPGIYLTWQECREQTDGFSSNNYRRFEDFDEAWRFARWG